MGKETQVNTVSAWVFSRLCLTICLICPQQRQVVSNGKQCNTDCTFQLFVTLQYSFCLLFLTSGFRLCLLVLRVAELCKGRGPRGLQHGLCLPADRHLSSAAGPPHTTGGAASDSVLLKLLRVKRTVGYRNSVRLWNWNKTFWRLKICCFLSTHGSFPFHFRYGLYSSPFDPVLFDLEVSGSSCKNAFNSSIGVQSDEIDLSDILSGTSDGWNE